jgi:hypothetical protein
MFERVGSSRPKLDRDRSKEHSVHKQRRVSRAPSGRSRKTEQARALRRDWRRRLFEIGDFIERFVICQTQADGIGQLRQ